MSDRCSVCNGSGKQIYVCHLCDRKSPCSYCNGTGEIKGECSSCNGSGNK